MRLPDIRRVVIALALALGASPIMAQQGADSLVTRVQQLVNLGNRSAAQAVADSAFLIRTPGTLAYAEALYARALATPEAISAERDYLRVGIEYPLSSRAEGALMMAGQLKMSRGDRNGARALFERMALEFPGSPQSARASYWAGRLALEDGDAASGCRSLQLASDRVQPEDVEFRNQIEYLRSRCTPTNAPYAPAADSSATQANPANATEAEPETSSVEYSVQVAAYSRKRDADATVSRLKARGFQVRITGTKSPYRVRIGRYATREEAVAAYGRMRRAGVTGMVVEAEPR